MMMSKVARGVATRGVNMYIGGGVGLILLIVVIVLLMRGR